MSKRILFFSTVLPRPERVYLLCGKPVENIRKDVLKLWPGVETIVLPKEDNCLTPEGAQLSLKRLGIEGDKIALVVNGGIASLQAGGVLASKEQVVIINLHPDGLDVIHVSYPLDDREGAGKVDFYSRVWNEKNKEYFDDWIETVVEQR